MIEKIDIKDASIAEEIRKQMAVATVSSKGLMSADNVLSLTTMKISTGTPGGQSTRYIRVIRAYNNHYKPIRLFLSYGSYNSSSRISIDIVITYGGGIVFKSGNGGGVVGYVTSQDGDYLDIYIKCPTGMSFVGTLVGGVIIGTEDVYIEPVGIVYAE